MDSKQATVQEIEQIRKSYALWRKAGWAFADKVLAYCEKHGHGSVNVLAEHLEMTADYISEVKRVALISGVEPGYREVALSAGIAAMKRKIRPEKGMTVQKVKAASSASGAVLVKNNTDVALRCVNDAEAKLQEGLDRIREAELSSQDKAMLTKGFTKLQATLAQCEQAVVEGLPELAAALQTATEESLQNLRLIKEE